MLGNCAFRHHNGVWVWIFQPHSPISRLVEDPIMRIDKIFGFGALVIAPALVNAQTSGGHPTYAKEVSRIIQDNCQICHQPGAIGPMSFRYQ